MARISAQTCLAFYVIIFCITSSLANEPCTEVGRSCESNSHCCSDCCTSGICLKSCAPQDNPCSRANCSGSEDCVLEKVDCILAPCEPAAVCKPKDPCLTVTCESGSHCKAKEVLCIRAPCPPVAQCIPNANSDPCAVIRCRSGYRCERQCSTTSCRGACVPDAKANPCDTVKCSAGHHCEPRQVQCYKAPCPPAVGRCVTDGHHQTANDVSTNVDYSLMMSYTRMKRSSLYPCATVRCASGTHCESKQEQCSAPPCKLVAECVQDVNPCAIVLCQTGTKCVIQPGSNTASCIPIHSGRGCKSE